MRRKRSHPLKTFREANDLNQREAARRFGVSQAQWSRYERGVDRPGRELAKKLIRETGVSLEVLMGMAS